MKLCGKISLVRIIIIYKRGYFNRFKIEMDFQNYQRLIDQQITNYQKTSGKAHKMYKNALNQI